MYVATDKFVLLDYNVFQKPAAPVAFWHWKFEKLLESSNGQPPGRILIQSWHLSITEGKLGENKIAVFKRSFQLQRRGGGTFEQFWFVTPNLILLFWLNGLLACSNKKWLIVFLPQGLTW